MGLKENLEAGEKAVEYVKKLGIIAANRRKDRLKAQGGIEKAIGTPLSSKFSGQAGAGVGYGRGLMKKLGTSTEMIATIAESMGYGNCHEQASIAMMQLKAAKISPLDLMAFTTKGYDHVWVVIGLSSTYQGDNLRSWGDDAVWCDPWQGDGVVFSITDFIKGKVRNLNFIYKCNTLESVEAGCPKSIHRIS